MFTKWKSWSIIFVAVCLLNGRLSAQTATQPAQLLKTEPAIHHFGNIPDSQVVRCQFVITNGSDKTVNFTKVESPCGCTTAKPEPDTMPPGGKSTVVLTINPKGRTGYLQWDIGLVHNLSAEPLYLAFDMNVFKDNFISHDFCYLGEIRRGTTGEKKIWISPLWHPDFQIKAIQIEPASLRAYFDVSWEPTTYAGFYPGPRAACCLKVACNTTAPFGRLEGKIRLVTTIPDKQIIDIPLIAVIIGPIATNRDYLAMGPIARGQQVTKKVMVFHREAKSIALTAVRLSQPFLQAAVKPIVPGQYYEVAVTASVSATMPTGEFRETLTITTSNPEQPMLTMVVQGFVQVK